MHDATIKILEASPKQGPLDIIKSFVMLFAAQCTDRTANSRSVHSENNRIATVLRHSTF